MATAITWRQDRVLRFITGYQEACGGVSPFFREIAAGTGIASKSGVALELDRLGRAGLVRRLYNKEQAIEILSPVAIPRDPDGNPLYAVPGFGDAG